MKRALFLGLIGGLAIFLNSRPAQATLLDFVPAVQAVEMGSSVDGSIRVSGLDDFVAPSPGTFDLDLAFDPPLLVFGSATIGDLALGDQRDLFGLGSVTNISADTPGVVSLLEPSLETASDLNTLQHRTFTLATFTFNTLGVGTSPLTLPPLVLGDAHGRALAATTESGSIEVTGIAVLGAASIWLLGIGLTALASPRWSCPPAWSRPLDPLPA